MSKLLPLTIGIFVGGCAGVRPDATTGSDVAQALQGRVAMETRSCVSSSPGGSLHVLDSRTIAYEAGGTLWLNRVRVECPGLNRLGTLAVESRSGQYCSGDYVRLLEWGSSAVPGASCVLGDFTAYRRPG